jgi:YidC/Oxa1 family membrane protein insertase
MNHYRHVCAVRNIHLCCKPFSLLLLLSRLDDLTLARYHETVDDTSPEIVLLNPSGTTLPYYAEYGWRADEGVKVPDQNSVWKVASGRELSPGHPVVLKFDNGAGLVFEKTFALDDKYMLTITQKVTKNSGADVSLYPYSLIAREIDPKHRSIYIQHEGPIGVLGGDLVEFVSRR